MRTHDYHQGIWIDRHKAYVFTFEDDQLNVELLDSEIETRNRIEGESRSNGRFGDQYIDTKKKKDHRISEQTQLFLKKVKSRMHPSAKIVLFGPSDTKNKLNSLGEIENIVGVEPADSMTKNQMAAWVRDYFEI